MKIKQRGNSFFVMDGERHVCRISCDNDDAERVALRFAASEDLLAACKQYLAAGDLLVQSDDGIPYNTLHALDDAAQAARAAIEKMEE